MSLTYVEAESNIPVYASVDVLVLGGGPAGLSAAISAAREGANTLLVESSSDVGGVATSGMMSHWTGHTKGGLYQEILDRTARLYGENPKVSNADMKKFIDHETLKSEALNMLQESRARILLNTIACKSIMKENKLEGVIIENKSGRQVIFCKIAIDCTGDGDIAAHAGVEYFKGRESDGAMQPMTLMVQIGGVDTKQIEYVNGFEDSYEVPQGDIQTLARKHIQAPAGHVLIYPTVFPNIVILNMTNVIGADGTNAEDVTNAYIASRNQLPEIMDFLHKFVPGFENSYILKCASQIGIRETRHFKGIKTISEEDIWVARVFEDWAVANVQFNFDVHNITGAGLDQTGCQKHFTQSNGYTIPFGCFVPEKIDGLLLAGRNISGTHLAHSNFRAMPICANMGQATGVAAAMCVEEQCEPRYLKINALQDRMKKLGVYPK